MDKPELIVQLKSLVYGGRALSRLPDGRAVFVPFGIPGEKVRVRLIEEKRGHAQAEMLEVLEASPMRIQPVCRHFGTCGGCHYQHLPYEQQLVAKSAILHEQMERIAGLSSPPVESCVPCPNPFRYRNYVQFHLFSTGRLGFYQWDEQEVFPIEECLLIEERLDQIWPQLDFEAFSEIKRIGLRAGEDDDLQLIIESDDTNAPEISVEELPISVVHLSPAGSLVLAGSPVITINLLGRDFRVSADSFFQVNTAMAAEMVKFVMSHVGKTNEMTVLDLYCGVGLFSAFLAGQVGRLIGVEASPSACDDFAFNLAEFDNVELYEANVKDVLPAIQVNPDLVIVDPPRAGIGKEVIDYLIAMSPSQIIYISCDPATLARDARQLINGGYVPMKITPFDLFPQTYHIESISFWEKDTL